MDQVVFSDVDGTLLNSEQNIKNMISNALKN